MTRRGMLRAGSVLSALMFAAATSARAEATLRLPPTLENWRKGDERWFTGATLVGGTQLRAVASAGYGRPHWTSVSVEVSGLVAPTYAQSGAHLVGSLPLVQLQLGWVAQSFFRSGTMPLADSYTEAQLDGAGGRARYSNLDALLIGRIPLRPFVLFVRQQVFWAPWLDADTAVPAVQRFTLRPPWANVTQVFPMWTWGDDARFRIGAASEFIWPGGGASLLLRLGPAFSADLTAHTDVWTFLNVAVLSPDDVGIEDELYGGVVLRYRWASGEPEPAFP